MVNSNKYGSGQRIANVLGIGNRMGNTLSSIIAEKGTCCGDPATPECCNSVAALRFVSNNISNKDILLRDLFSTSAYNELWTKAMDVFYSKKNDGVQADAGIGVNKSWSPLVTTLTQDYVPTKVATSEKIDYLQYANVFSNNSELGNNINQLMEGKFVPLFEVAPENLMYLNTINTRFNIYSLGGGARFDGMLLNVLLIKRTVDAKGGITFTKEVTLGQLDLTKLALGAGEIYEYNRSLVIPNTVYAKVSNLGTFSTDNIGSVNDWADFKKLAGSTIAYNTTVSWFFGFELAASTTGTGFVEIFANLTNRYAFECDGCVKGGGKQEPAPCGCASITEDYSYWNY